MKYWLAKQEPSGPRGYSFEQFKKDGKTVWDGVHNNLALKHMRSMSKGDLVLYYHTGTERRADRRALVLQASISWYELYDSYILFLSAYLENVPRF